MRIQVNGEERETKARTLRELFESLGVPPDERGVAVAVGGAVVPRSKWAETALSEGDAIEIIRAVQGGSGKDETMADDRLTFGGHSFRSRLIIGSARYPNQQVMLDAIAASGAEIVTVAIRRVDLKDPSGEGVLDVLRRAGYTVLPNTAGCYTAKDAVLTAQLAREALGTSLIKLEVIGDDRTLFPDVEQLVRAASELVADGFTVLPYSNDDPITAKKLEDVGCAAVMPLGAPIGSGMGIRNPYNLAIMRETIDLPLIVDAGVGTASDAAIAMELGMDGILLNTAVAGARDPVRMARAMRLAVEAGRLAFLAGRIPKKLYATASSPLEGVIGT